MKGVLSSCFHRKHGRPPGRAARLPLFVGCVLRWLRLLPWLRVAVGCVCNVLCCRVAIQWNYFITPSEEAKGRRTISGWCVYGPVLLVADFESEGHLAWCFSACSASARQRVSTWRFLLRRAPNKARDKTKRSSRTLCHNIRYPTMETHSRVWRCTYLFL